MICPKCKSGYFRQERKDFIDPANDVFRCKQCEHAYKRYAGTEHETFREWCKRFDVLPTTPTTECGAVSVIVDKPDVSLWHLSDYAVSTVSGPVVWLVPRR
jgi:hypothetical protein